MTAGELAFCVREQEKNEWDRWSALLAITHNNGVAKKSDAKRPEDFNPYHQKQVIDLNTPEGREQFRRDIKRAKGER